MNFAWLVVVAFGSGFGGALAYWHLRALHARAAALRLRLAALHRQRSQVAEQARTALDAADRDV